MIKTIAEERAETFLYMSYQHALYKKNQESKAAYDAAKEMALITGVVPRAKIEEIEKDAAYYMDHDC